MARNKYGNRKVTTADGTFDSVAEYEYWLYLRGEQDAGRIENLERQPSFELIPRFKTSAGKVERAVAYTPDFSYTENGQHTVIEVKGVATRDYVIRRKLFQYTHPEILFIEVKV